MRITKRMRRLRAEVERWVAEQPYEILPWQINMMVALAARIEIQTQRRLQPNHNTWKPALDLVNLARGE